MRLMAQGSGLKDLGSGLCKDPLGLAAVFPRISLVLLEDFYNDLKKKTKIISIFFESMILTAVFLSIYIFPPF